MYATVGATTGGSVMQANAEQVLASRVYHNGMNQPALGWSTQPDPSQAGVCRLVDTTICAHVHDLRSGCGDGDVTDIQVFQALIQGRPRYTAVLCAVDASPLCPHVDHIRIGGSNGQGQDASLYSAPVDAPPRPSTIHAAIEFSRCGRAQHNRRARSPYRGLQ